MIKSLFQKKPTVPQESSLLPPAVSWDEVSSQEEALLLKVEAKVLHYYDQTNEQAKEQAISPYPSTSSRAHPKAEKSSSLQKRPLHMGWTWATCGVLGLVALLTWREMSKQDILPSLKIQGSVELQTLSSPQGGQHLRVLLAPKGELADPQGWSLKAQSQATLRIHRTALRKAISRLDHGAVTFWVTPRSMKQFEVSCKNKLRVVVKGTIFAVWQQHASLRVEVFRGHVILKQANHGLLHLYKEQGVRIDHASPSRWKTYRVAPKPQGWLSKIEWMALHQPAHLFDYAQDIERDHSISQEQRLQALELAAHALTGAKRWQEAFLLWFRLANVKDQGYNAQTALFQAAQNCRLSQTQGNTCIRLYRLFLKRFPQAMAPLRDTSMAWLGRLLYKHPNPAYKQQARTLFKRYLTIFPKGSQATLIRRYLRR